jgi:hypothetical protein
MRCDAVFTFVYSLAQRRYDQIVTMPHHYDNKLWSNQLPSHSTLVDRTETKGTEECGDTPFSVTEEINFACMAVTNKSLISEAFSQNQPSTFWICHSYVRSHRNTLHFTLFNFALKSLQSLFNFNYIRIITTNTFNLRERWWWTINVLVWHWSKELICAQTMFFPLMWYTNFHTYMK